MPAGFRPLVVDNGSSDGSAASWRRRSARRSCPSRERGFGAACFAGLAAARSEVVCFMDCDGSLDPGELPLVSDPVASATGRIWCWVRAGRSPARGLSTRGLPTASLALELRRRSGLRLRDLGPMRAARREALLALEQSRTGGFGWPLEMALRAAAVRLARSRGRGQLSSTRRAVARR